MNNPDGLFTTGPARADRFSKTVSPAPVDILEQLPKPKTAHLITSNEKDQSFGARFLVHLEKIKQEPEYDAVLIDEAQDFDPSWFQCALRLMRDPHDDEQRMLFYVALTRAKDFLAAIPKECRDLLLFLLKMALYDREWLFCRYRHILPVPRSARQLLALPQLSFLTPRLGH